MKEFMNYIKFTNTVFTSKYGIMMIVIFILLSAIWVMWSASIANKNISLRTVFRTLLTSLCMTYYTIFIFAVAVGVIL